MIKDGLGAELHNLGYFGGILLFEEIQAKDRLALAGQFFDLLMDVLQEDGPDAFGLDMFFDTGFEIGEIVVAFALAAFEAEEVDGLVANDDIKPAFDMFEGFHARAGVEEFVEGIGDDVFGVGLRVDDILHEVGEGADHLVIHHPEGFFVALPEGDDDRFFVAANRLFWF